jgi:hypothetical protein
LNHAARSRVRQTVQTGDSEEESVALKAFADTDKHPHFVELSFASADSWATPSYLRAPTRTDGAAPAVAALLLGDAVRGPLIVLTAVQPGTEPPYVQPRGHASDNFRVSLRGTLPVGSERYSEGEFRFQRGWEPYAGDSYARGVDGGWTVLCFADRRGVRDRFARPDALEQIPGDANLAAWLGIDGDLISYDPRDTAGDSALAVTFASSRGSHVNGAYAQAHSWVAVGDATRAVGALMGDRRRGPLMILARTSSNRLSASRFTVSTEVMHVVVRGTCTIGDRVHGTGDVRVTRADVARDPVVAGPDGVDELIVFGDRRGAHPRFLEGPEGWPTVIASFRHQLSSALRR